MKPIRGFLVLALLAMSPAWLLAQQSTGDIYGILQDSEGGVLPGVMVTLTGSQIGQMTQVSGMQGDFRFIRLSPGDYDLECQLDGFATYVQKAVQVVTGGAVNLKITMQAATVSETITVTAEQPILDTRKTGVGQNVTQEVLANIPTARDPWVVLSMISGIVVDRVNIGGAEGGQQSYFTSRGENTRGNAMWNMDGITITDMASTGASTSYFDFDTFEELQVTTGGNDPSQATGGMGINFVTKRGGDMPKGSARFIVTSEGLQSDNTKELATPEHGGSEDLDGYVWNSEFTRPILSKLRDYGIEIGGPIIKEKAWYWGAVGVQDIQLIAVNGAPDNTQLENISLKFNAQATESLGLTYFYYRGDKVKRGRNAGATRPTETTTNQWGPTNIHKVEANYLVNPNLFIDGKFGYFKSTYYLEPNGGMDRNMWRDVDGVWHNTYSYFESNQPNYQVTLDTNYFANALGGSHEFKVGFSYRRFDNDSSTRYPGNKVVADEYNEIAWITRDSHAKTRNKYLAFYAGDTYTRGRLTANIGFRYDRQNGELLPVSVGANPLFPDILPGVSVAAIESPFTWSNFSPRLGMTYDLLGDGKTILRANFARYADQLPVRPLWRQSPVTYVGELDYLWSDLNGDHEVQPDEIDWDYGPYGIYYVDPLDPQSSRSTTVVNPDLKAPTRMEFIVGGEREIMQNFSVGANFVWRKSYDLLWSVGTDYKNPNRPYTYSDYELAGYVTGTLPDGTPYNMPYYSLRPERADMVGAGIDQLYTNQDGYNDKYQGLEVFATKRLSDKWMLNASFNWQRNRGYYSGTAGISDPTNVNDGENTATNSGKDGWVSTPEWTFVMNGLYQLPYQISVSGNLISRQGFPVVYYERKSGVDPGISYKNVRAQLIGDWKLPNMIELDFRVSKAVSLGDKGNVSLDLDVFNILNRNTPLYIQERLKRSNTNQVQDLMYPRIVRFGVRYQF